jgi:hypothetical protein
MKKRVLQYYTTVLILKMESFRKHMKQNLYNALNCKTLERVHKGFTSRFSTLLLLTSKTGDIFCQDLNI